MHTSIADITLVARIAPAARSELGVAEGMSVSVVIKTYACHHLGMGDRGDE